MKPANGQATAVTKIGLETYLYYNTGTIEDVGVYASAGSGTGTFTPGDAVLPSGGADLMLRTNVPIKSEQDMVVTVTGTDDADAALTGSATIGAEVAEGQAYVVTPNTAGKKFKTVTTVTATNGVLGDGFELCTMLNHDNDQEIGLAESANVDPGTEIKPIYSHYDLFCNKRIRGDKKLTITSLYRANTLDLSKIHNRDVVVRIDIKDDGGNVATETWLLDKCRLGVKKDFPAGSDDVKESAEGTFGRRFIFD